MIPVARLDSRALVKVSGPDARPFLHNLLTQDVETLQPGELRFGALLSAPGRVLFDLFLFGEDDGVLLDVARDRRDALIQRLSMYRLRAQVEISADDRNVFAAIGQTPDGFAVDPRVAALGGRTYGGGYGITSSEDIHDRHRLDHGLPNPDADVPTDGAYPIEADFDVLNGIDFQKGCFIGQETTSRMKRKGGIRKRMLPIDFEGDPPPVGAEVLNGELRAGEVRTGHMGRAIALLRLDRIDGDLTVDGRPVTVSWPEWLGPRP